MGHDSAQLLQQFGRDVAAIFGRGAKAHCEIGDDGWLALTGESGSPDFNMCAIAPTASRDLIGRYVRAIRERSLDAIMFVDEQAPDLAKAAEDLGLQPVGTVPVMVWRNRGALERKDRFHVRPATHDEHETVCELIGEAFSVDAAAIKRALPPGTYSGDVQAWVVEQDGALVGTGTTVRSGDHVGVYSMATPERYQRQGIGRAVLESAMAHHIANGVTTFTLEATPAGRHLYEQVGYRTAATPTVLSLGASAG